MITVEFGPGNVVSQDVSRFADRRVSTIVNTPAIKALLGYGDSIATFINGHSVEGDTLVQDGVRIVVTTRANTKGVKKGKGGKKGC